MNIEKIFNQVLDHPDPLRRFAELVRQDEREACARLCDDLSEGLVGDDVDGAWGAGHCARAIEARGSK